MRRYSFVIFICIFISAVFTLVYQERSFIESEPIEVYREYQIDQVEKRPNYTMLYSGDSAIIQYEYSSLDYTDNILPGSVIAVEGKVAALKGHPQRGYANYLRSRGYNYLINGNIDDIVSHKSNFRTLIYEIREYLGKYIDSIYRVDSPFVKALVYGDRAEMNENDTELFSKTGISHLLAISGFHIGLLASMALILLKKLPSNIRYFIVLGFIFIYVIITGARPSAIRAGIFYLMYIASIFYCKRYDVISSAFLLSSVLIALNPYILYDAGFTLSFMAVISIGMFYQSINATFEKTKILPKYIANLTSMTISAQVLTLPLTYFYFQRISIISIFSNLISVPLVTLTYPFMLSSLVLYKIPFLGNLLVNMVKSLKFILYYFNQKISAFSLSYIDFEASNIYTTIVAYVLIFTFYFIFAIYTLKENKNELQGFAEKYWQWKG